MVNNIDKIMFFICVMDTLFFPYIRIASASLSMILLPIWYLFNLKKIKATIEFKFFLFLILLLTISLSLSAITYPESMFLKTNAIYSIILLFGFLYYFFYKYYFESKNLPLRKYLTAYLMFGATLALVYLVSPSSYFNIRSFWTMSGDTIEVTNSLTIFRFTSTFMDPNNAAIAFVAVLAFLLFNEKIGLLQRLFLVSMTALILAATMSSTGFISFGLLIVFYASKTIITKKVLKRQALLHLSLLFFLSPILFWVAYNFLGSDLTQMALDRVTSTSSDSADSRIDKWIELLESDNIFKYLIYGTGGVVILDGSIFKPHNGHLQMIYSYGMLAYVIFLFIFFRKRKGTSLQSYFFLVPFFLGFTINVGIHDPRFIILLALLSASYANNVNKGLSNKTTISSE